MYDYSKLVGRIIEKFSTQAAFAVAVRLSERSVSLKLNNKRDWKQGEIQKACEVLSIEAQDIPAYFFAPRVQY